MTAAQRVQELNERGEDINNVSIVFRAAKRGQTRTYNSPTTSEIALIVVKEDEERAESRPWDLRVQWQNGDMQIVDVLHPALDMLAYPLIFPNGDNGWEQNILYRTPPALGGQAGQSVAAHPPGKFHK